MTAGYRSRSRCGGMNSSSHQSRHANSEALDVHPRIITPSPIASVLTAVARETITAIKLNSQIAGEYNPNSTYRLK